MVTINMLSVGQTCSWEVVASRALILFFRKEFTQLCGEYLYSGGGVCVFEVHRNENSN